MTVYMVQVRYSQGAVRRAITKPSDVSKQSRKMDIDDYERCTHLVTLLCMCTKVCTFDMCGTNAV